MNGQRIVLADRVVQTWADIGASLRVGYRFTERSWVQARVKHYSVDGRKIVGISALRAKKKRSALAKRPADAAIVLRRFVPRFLPGERVRRVKSRVITAHIELPMKFVGAGFGED